MDNCTECYIVCDPIPDCLTSLAIMTDQVSQSITVRLTDKFNQIYYKSLTTEPSGLFILDLADDIIFPLGLINEAAGQFKLSVIKDGQNVPFTVDSKEYGCLMFEAKRTTPRRTYYTIDVYGYETGGY